MIEPIAVCRSVEDLHQALRARAEFLQLARRKIDELAGISDGYSAKLLSDPPYKNLGPVSMFPLLGALGLVVGLLEDAEMMRGVSRYGRRMEQRVRNEHNHWRRNAKAFAQTESAMARLGREGGLKSVAMLTPDELRQKLSKAAKARWRKWRRERKLLARRAANTERTTNAPSKICRIAKQILRASDELSSDVRLSTPGLIHAEPHVAERELAHFISERGHKALSPRDAAALAFRVALAVFKTQKLEDGFAIEVDDDAVLEPTPKLKGVA